MKRCLLTGIFAVLGWARAETALEISDYTVDSDSTVTVDVLVDCPDLKELMFDVYFREGEEPEVVEYVSGSAAYDSSRARSVEIFPNTSGGLSFVAASLEGIVVVDEGSGALFSFQLRGISPGMSTLHIVPERALKPTDFYPFSEEPMVSVDGSVTVDGPAVPVAAPGEGTYNGAQTVTLTSTAGTDIHYTLDGTTPNAGSTLYTMPVEVTGDDGETVPLKVVGIDAMGRKTYAEYLYHFDFTAPTVVVEQAAAQADPTNTEPIYFTAFFSEPVYGFDIGRAVPGGDAWPDEVTVAAGLDGDDTRQLAVSGMTGNGTVSLVLEAGSAHDEAGNPALASTSTDNTVLFDEQPPEVTIEPPSETATRSGPVLFPVLITGAETVALDPGDVSLVPADTGVTATISVDVSNPFEPVVTLSDLSGDGMVGLAIAAGVAVDGVGNGSAAVVGDPTLEVDNTAPPPPAAPDLADEDDTGLSASDNVTNLTTGLTIAGQAEAGTLVRVYVNGAEVFAIASALFGTEGG